MKQQSPTIANQQQSPPMHQYQRQSQPQQSQSQPPRKKGTPFCKVCFDAGKSDKEYTSHYLRSAPGPDGKLVCPTLLNQSCLTCGQRGHTSSYCDQSKYQDQVQVQTKRINATPLSAEAELRRLTATFRKPEHYNPKSNPFGALNEQIPTPMTMAEKLKLTPQSTVPKPPLLTGMPPKSQFWWQDE